MNKQNWNLGNYEVVDLLSLQLAVNISSFHMMFWLLLVAYSLTGKHVLQLIHPSITIFTGQNPKWCSQLIIIESFHHELWIELFLYAYWGFDIRKVKESHNLNKIRWTSRFIINGFWNFKMLHCYIKLSLVVIWLLGKMLHFHCGVFNCSNMTLKKSW